MAVLTTAQRQACASSIAAWFSDQRIFLETTATELQQGVDSADVFYEGFHADDASAGGWDTVISNPTKFSNPQGRTIVLKFVLEARLSAGI